LIDGIALVATWPCALTCRVEQWFGPEREGVFLFWAHVFALAPGLPGVYLRKAFYRQTLAACDKDFYIGFGSYFTHRTARVEIGVYIGSYALVGSAILRANCLIGSRASLLSGGALHRMDDDGNWLATDRSQLQQIEIGHNAWLGEGVITMSDVGARAMVAAGSVVSAPVPERVMVGGNPARFVKYLSASDEPTASAHPCDALPLHSPSTISRSVEV
jgi:acetyltransferase-like isoleucine patch superfamily enzyme